MRGEKMYCYLEEYCKVVDLIESKKKETENLDYMNLYSELLFEMYHTIEEILEDKINNDFDM